MYLNAKQSMQDLSSSWAKVILGIQWNIREYVPMIVKQAMEWRMNGQYLIGITGAPWVWKSFTSDMFFKLCEKNWINAHHLDMDKIAHDIQWPLQEGIYQKTRQEIIHTFGDDIANEDGSINRKLLGPKVFDDPHKLEILNDIMRDPMTHRRNALMYNQKWLFIYDAALIAEDNTSGIVNNNMILVNVPPEIQAQRLAKRGLSWKEIQKRLSSQFTTENKSKALSEAIVKDEHGKTIELQSPYSDKDAEIAFNKMLAQIDSFGELRFGGLLNRLGVKQDPKQLFMKLRDTYDRPIAADARRDEITKKMKGNYHKRLHVVDCLNEFYQVRHLMNDPDAVECALLFHDIIYTPGEPTNEEDSAEYAEYILTERWLAKDFIDKVKQLILATKHTHWSIYNDTKYMMDIDMSILGKSPRAYAQYAKDVRREYYMYSDKRYDEWRIHFLEWVLKKLELGTLFYTEYFQHTYTEQTKQNISWELRSLSSKQYS